MNFLPLGEVRRLINGTNGRFFSAIVQKQNGSLRTFNARLGVSAHVLGTGRGDTAEVDEATDNCTVWDNIANNYRRIKLTNVVRFQCGDVVVEADNKVEV